MKLPEEVDDDQAILLSDIVPTGYMAADNAQIKPGNTIAVFGLGPVGQFCIASAKFFDVGRIIAVDTIPSRLEMARAQGAEVIDFNQEDPIAAIKDLTDGIGVDRVIDAVGVDANMPHSGPAAKLAAKKHAKEKEKVAPDANPKNGNWEPGDACIDRSKLGRRGGGQGRYDFDRWCLWRTRFVSDRRRHGEEPHADDGELQSPAVPAASD